MYVYKLVIYSFSQHSGDVACVLLVFITSWDMKLHP